MKQSLFLLNFFLLILAYSSAAAVESVEYQKFQTPPDSARPWTYWFIMDGNLDKSGITADFEAMKKAGIGGIIIMEVNIGVPRGKVDFMSPMWLEYISFAIHEAERLGLQVTMNSGPGWTGSGGPWIKPEHSMLHLVASETIVKGPVKLDEKLPNPIPRKPYFGEGALPPDQEKARKEWFKDVKVLAFPVATQIEKIKDIDEKALVYRAPYSSSPGVKPRLESNAEYDAVTENNAVNPAQILDLTDKLAADGTLNWNVPDGEWTILRFAATTTGANTRPAPQPGLGLEASKMDRDFFDVHYDNYIGKLFKTLGKRQTDGKAGLCYFHIDSWEMGSQNFSFQFFDEFRKRRGYEPTPYLPVYHGLVVGNNELSERFLWDVRQTAQELIIQNHGVYLRELAHKNNMKLSVEPYDMMPCCDMAFGAVADLPMCEFWSEGYGFDSVYSCFEATSIAHTHGIPLVGAEAFTSSHDKWRQNPKSMKRQGDWAFCMGINRVTFHRFQHQLEPTRSPGFSMGIHGVHWERTQTWWDLSLPYHQYLARCQSVLQQGTTVSDILYLLPEGAPQVFTPPNSALLINGVLKDKRGHQFDGCDPGTLIELAAVKDGRIVFPNGTEYSVLVLPKVETMTLPLLKKIEQLVNDGAMVIGNPPQKSPSLQNYPKVDEEVQTLAGKIWTKKNVVALSAKNVAKKKPIKIAGAKWVWFPEGNPAFDAPAGTRYFRKTVSIADDVKIVDAQLLGIADNELTVRVNGKTIHQTNLVNPLKSVTFTDSLKRGDNIIELEAVNGTSDQRNPAGLIAAFEIQTVDGQNQPHLIRLTTDATWNASQDKKEWKNATILGDFGIGPWSVAEYNAASQEELYSDYNATAKILESAGLPVDLEAPNETIRFTHRKIENADYYFIANRSANTFDGDITFRVTGKKASIWNPLTGQRFRTLPAHDDGKRTTIPIPLEGYESLFVVFDENGVTAENLVWRNAPTETLQELNDNWTVSFNPLYFRHTAGENIQGKITMDKLIDWSTSSDAAIKYYSGIAKYEKTFELKEQTSRLFLDLGNVEVIARVKLNGKDIGTRWFAPYRLDITSFAKEGENKLEIEVANLWTNRLIGDAKLPEAERVTWSTWNGVYGEKDKLLPSGLLGPVRVLQAK